jgi:L-lactate dehydrogenase complex protein LldG
LILRDADCPYRLGALAPWFHVAVLRKSDICPTIAEAIANLGTDPSIIFVTGPSKTADIEGILIQGVHGPGIQGVLLV